jgi:hypothetical protein
MKKIRINNPCFESWDEMTSISEGVFVKNVLRRFGILQIKMTFK